MTLVWKLVLTRLISWISKTNIMKQWNSPCFFIFFSSFSFFHFLPHYYVIACTFGCFDSFFLFFSFSIWFSSWSSSISSFVLFQCSNWDGGKVETIAGGREVKTLSGSISPPPTFRSQWDVRRGREAALEAVSCANSRVEIMLVQMALVFFFVWTVVGLSGAGTKIIEGKREGEGTENDENS